MRRLTLALILIATPATATDVARSRVIHSDRSIVRLIGSLGLGALFSDATAGEIDYRGVQMDQDPVATIQRLWWYIRDDDRGEGTRVSYSYWLKIRGQWVHRRTVIQDGLVTLTTTLNGPLGPRGRLKLAVLTITARQSGDGTTITTAVWVRAHTGLNPGRDRSKCRLINRLASRGIADALDDGLRRLESGGRDVIQAGSLGSVVGELLGR